MIKTLTEKRIAGIEGFKVAKDFDFSDDGNRFTMWVYKGVPISQHRSAEYGTFLAIRPDYITSLHRAKLSDLTFDFPYDLWMKAEEHKLADEFNHGVDGFELEKLMKNAEKIRARIIELNKDFANCDIFTVFNLSKAQVVAQLRKEAEAVEKRVNDAKAKFNWLADNVTTYDLEIFKSYSKLLDRDVKEINELADDILAGAVNKSKLYEIAKRISNNGYYEYSIDKLSEDSYIEHLQKLVEKSAAA